FHRRSAGPLTCGQEPRESVEHPSLRPPYVRSSISIPSVLLEVEAAQAVPHLCQCPARDEIAHCEGFRLEPRERGKGHECLRRAVNIDRIKPFMIVLGCTVGKEEAIPVESVS